MTTLQGFGNPSSLSMQVTSYAYKWNIMITQVGNSAYLVIVGEAIGLNFVLDHNKTETTKSCTSFFLFAK